MLAALSLAVAPTALAHEECTVANASGKAKGKRVKKAVPMQPDTQSVGRVVNLGDDRESEVVMLHVNVSSGLPPRLERRMEMTIDPFVRTSDKTETVSFPDATFSKLDVSGNRKRISVKVCIDPPNNLPAGTYTGKVMLDGPRGVNGTSMTITLNAKDGHGFLWAALLTATLSFLILLYKAAGDKRAQRIAKAERKPAAEREAAVAEAARWRSAAKACIGDLGWTVPALVSVATAFGLLWAVYEGDPAWGAAGFVSSVIALAGTGLAAIGAKAIFTQSSPNP